MKMTTNGNYAHKRGRWTEVDRVKSKKDGIDYLKFQLGYIEGLSDERYLEILKETGVTVIFEED